MSKARIQINGLTNRASKREISRLVAFAVLLFLASALMPRASRAIAAGPVTFTRTNLVSDVPGMAKTTDPNLVNPWVMTLGLNSGLWVSDNGSGKATTYDGTGQPIPAGSPLVVTIPVPGGIGTSSPTGVATNDTRGFVISFGGNSGPSTELFATENGTIAGWNASVDPTHAVIAVNNSASGAVYRGSPSASTPRAPSSSLPTFTRAPWISSTRTSGTFECRALSRIRRSLRASLLSASRTLTATST
jgi:hypothetical protein